MIAAPSLAAPAPRVEIRGRITDGAGHGLPDVAVRFLQGRRDFKMLQWEYEDNVLQDVVTRTDEHGFFEAILAPDPEYRFFWLRFFEGASFDAVRYRRPEDLEITDQVRQGRPVIRSVVLEDHPDWVQVEAWLERLGPDSARGQVVRRLGIPDRREKVNGVESFWYRKTATIYRFQDGAFIGSEEWVISAGAQAAGS